MGRCGKPSRLRNPFPSGLGRCDLTVVLHEQRSFGAESRKSVVWRCILVIVADRYTEETLRLATLLKSLAKSKGRSIRSIEKQMGVGTSIFYKVLKGEVTLHVRHLLVIADAL